MWGRGEPTETGPISGCQALGGGGKGEADGHRVSLWLEENVLELVGGMVAQPSDCPKTHWSLYFTKVHFLVCEVCLNFCFYLFLFIYFRRDDVCESGLWAVEP